MNFDNIYFNGYSLSDNYIEDHCNDYTDEEIGCDEEILDYLDEEDDEF